MSQSNQPISRERLVEMLSLVHTALDSRDPRVQAHGRRLFSLVHGEWLSQKYLAEAVPVATPVMVRATPVKVNPVMGWLRRTVVAAGAALAVFGMPASWAVTVQAGDTLTSIVTKAEPNATWTRIMAVCEANQLQNCDHIRPGMNINLYEGVPATVVDGPAAAPATKVAEAPKVKTAKAAKVKPLDLAPKPATAELDEHMLNELLYGDETPKKGGQWVTAVPTDFQWTKPGANPLRPYLKTEADHAKAVALLGLKADEIEELRGLIAGQQSEIIKLQKGDRFDRMLFGNFRVATNVTVAFEAGENRFATMYTLSNGKRVYKPNICDNWAVNKPLPKPAVPPPTGKVEKLPDVPNATPPVGDTLPGAPVVSPGVPVSIVPAAMPVENQLVSKEVELLCGELQADGGVERYKKGATEGTPWHFDIDVRLCDWQETADGKRYYRWGAVAHGHGSRSVDTDWQGRVQILEFGPTYQSVRKDGSQGYTAKVVVGQRHESGHTGVQTGYEHDVRQGVVGFRYAHFNQTKKLEQLKKPEDQQDRWFTERWILANIDLGIGSATGTASYQGKSMAPPKFGGMVDLKVRQFVYDSSLKSPGYRVFGDLGVWDGWKPTTAGITGRIGVSFFDDALVAKCGLNYVLRPTSGVVPVCGVEAVWRPGKQVVLARETKIRSGVIDTFTGMVPTVYLRDKPTVTETRGISDEVLKLADQVK